MGKTYRNAPNDYDDFGKDTRKVKRVDKKHGKVIVRDGAYGSDTSDAFMSNGKKTIRRDWEGDGHFTNKKLDKRAKSKFERRNGEIPEED